MSDIINKSAIDTERRKAKDELVELIDEFLKACNQTVDEENIVEFVYIFLERGDFRWILHEYSDAAASALSFFATDEKMCSQFRTLYGDDFYFLCQMLQKLVEFCNNISSSEPNLARLDKAKWEIGQRSISSKEILKEKEIYELKLKHVREKIELMQSGKW